MHVAIREDDVSAAGLKAVDLAVVGAVDRARSQIGNAVGQLALENDPALEVVPCPALDYLILTTLAGEPAPRPAGNFGKKDRIRRAIARVCNACGVGFKLAVKAGVGTWVSAPL